MTFLFVDYLLWDTRTAIAGDCSKPWVMMQREQTLGRMRVNYVNCVCETICGSKPWVMTQHEQNLGRMT